MPSERMQRRIDAFLDEADEAATNGDWAAVAEKGRAVLAIDATNEDAAGFLQMAVANGISEIAPPAAPSSTAVDEVERAVEDTPATQPAAPESFAGGRYRVLRFLGEGGKKRVFLAHDTLLDRDIAFSLIKTEGLDEVGRQRIMREAQAMGRLTHANIVSIYDIGEHVGVDGTKQPYLVQELMGGGDVEGLLEDSEEGLTLAKALDIATATARGLEFAHAHGVVHRDLKPGNVWLTSDGVAKIGDLGLAVTLGESRLTTHGMMVGTYGYMPPEQALGQEVTAQADLYSLGAMLYELVTGRPPFQGDTPTAVISQHLNTQPVAPSWHSDHCPPDLEALILHLLAKVPADRPASATEVIAALVAVDPEARSTSHTDSQSNPLDRLARGIFVGRERELEQLRESLDAALQGRGSVVMLVGEPGIGKTRAVQELETYARMRGAEVYWGRTHESAGMPAYWPWRQIGLAWGADRDLATLATQGSALRNPELVRFFPELRQVIPGLAEPPEREGDASTQFLMFDAYAQFMRSQSATTPWVVVLDDLHWADKATLQLLQYAARELANMNVLIVGTYRDTDLVRTHPLSETLAELNRESGFGRIPLKGLSRDEVASYVHQRAGTDPVPALIDRLYEETEGNPFFLSEMVNLMVDEGTLDSTSVSEMALPDGVREALGRRLDRLSEEANELLQTAAVVGREFAHETLDLLSEHDTEVLLGLVEEGLRARVIEEGERAGRYRFSHAMMQEVLLAELSTTRRIRLHGQVGEALERRWGERADENASLLALHFLESSSLTPSHTDRAVRYLTIAGRQAEANSAWAEASRLYGEAVDQLGSDAEAELLEALGRSAAIATDYATAWASSMRALDLYRRSGDAEGFARTALPLTTAQGSAEAIAGIKSEALELLGERDLEVAGLLGAELRRGRPRYISADVLRRAIAASDQAEAAGIESVIERRGRWRVDDAFEAGDFATAVKEMERSVAAVGRVPNLFQGAYALSAVGRLKEGQALLREGLANAEALHDSREASFYLSAIAADRLLEADWASFDDIASSAAAAQLLAATWPHALSYRHELTGNFVAALEALHDPREWRDDPWTESTIRFSSARTLWRAGDGDGARQMLLATDPDTRSAGRLCFLDGIALELLKEPAWLPLVNEFVERAPVFVGGMSAVRAAGDFLLHLDRVEEARQRYAQSLDICSREGFPIEIARSQIGLGAIAERDGRNGEAMQLLDEAGAVLAHHGATYFLDQVIAKKKLLGG